jgi:hypothetical protein
LDQEEFGHAGVLFSRRFPQWLALDLDDLAARIGYWHPAKGFEARRRYFTANILRLDPGRHCAECLNAGHPPGFLVMATATIHRSKRV